MAGPILITGASGFVGGYLLEYLADRGEVEAWTRTRPPAAFVGLARWRHIDLLDRAAVTQAVAQLRPAEVYHCAGSSQIASSWQDTASPLQHNVIGSHHLYDALRRTGHACRVLVPGSASIYASSATPIDEAHKVAPSSPYALSKFAQEQLSLRAMQEDGLEIVATRSFNHTGPRQTSAFVVPSLARQVALIERGSTAPEIKVGNLDARRDFTDVRDVVAAYVALMHSGESGAIYNVASGTATSIGQMVDALIARATLTVRVLQDPSRLRPHDTPALVGDARRLLATTGWKPKISFDQMIDDLLAYWRLEVSGQ